MTSGASSPVGRASGDLSIRCTLAGHPPALGTAVSRGNAGLAGNIIFGGVIGAAVDASTGAAYSYPAWMQLVFGEERLFDRSGNRYDGPVAGQLVRALPPLANSNVTAGTGPSAASGAGAGATPRRGDAPPAARATVAEARDGLKAPLQRGDVLEYSLTDESTGSRSAVQYTLDRVTGDEMSFNAGSRIERLDGSVVTVRSPVGGLFESAMPAGGWVRPDVQQGQTWRASSKVYTLTARASGESTFNVSGEALKVVAIRYEGWQSNVVLNNASSQRTSPVTFVVLYAPELRRVVQFKAETTVFGGTAKETLALQRIYRN